MDKTEILNEITIIFKKVLKNDSIILAENTSANDIDEWDSINHTILMGEIQKYFKVKFKLKEILKLENVGDICDLVISKK